MLLKITVDVFPGLECLLTSPEVPVCMQKVPRVLGGEMFVATSLTHAQWVNYKVSKWILHFVRCFTTGAPESH